MPLTSSYLDSVRRAVLDRMEKLSNDDLSGDEDALVSAVANLLGTLRIFVKDYDVGLKASINRHEFHFGGCFLVVPTDDPPH